MRSCTTFIVFLGYCITKSSGDPSELSDTVEADSGSIRNALRSSCRFEQNNIADYRKCLANSSKDQRQAWAVVYELNDFCSNSRRCGVPRRDVDKVKNCYLSIDHTNKFIPWRDWHGYLFEDIMVGCLSKENLSRTIIIGKGTVVSGGIWQVHPDPENKLERLLNGSIPGKELLKHRISNQCQS